MCCGHHFVRIVSGYSPRHSLRASPRAKRNRAIRFDCEGALSVSDGSAAVKQRNRHLSLTVAVRGSV